MQLLRHLKSVLTSHAGTGQCVVRGAWTASAALLIMATPPSVSAQQTSSDQHGAEQGGDLFEFQGRTTTTIRMFERALMPGPSGAIVSSRFMAPIHQSLSAHAAGVDSPMGKDSLEVQVAAYGQAVPGADDAVQPTTWDVSSAFLRQKWKGVSLSLGRQVQAGGAARYSRFDGAKLSVSSDFGLNLVGYGGLVALPRWDQRYGYHHLGDAYEDWNSGTSERYLEVDRVDYWTAGARLSWSNSKIGGLGVSIHQQGEQQQLYTSTLGVEGHLTAVRGFELVGDALFNTDRRRFSDVRILGRLSAWENEHGGLVVRGEYLHTAPALLLSQASVLSVFSYNEVSEVGGDISLGLPHGFQVEAAGYAQMMRVGEAGLRSRLGVRFRHGDRYPFMVRFVVERLSTESNGYVLARAATTYEFVENVTLYADLYHYLYDEQISDVRSSAFYAAHLGYDVTPSFHARVGGSWTRSPYARHDLQALAQVSYQFDARGP